MILSALENKSELFGESDDVHLKIVCFVCFIKRHDKLLKFHVTCRLIYMYLLHTSKFPLYPPFEQILDPRLPVLFLG